MTRGADLPQWGDLSRDRQNKINDDLKNYGTSYTELRDNYDRALEHAGQYDYPQHDWYQTAHADAGRMARHLGGTTGQAATALARTSPQQNWNDNRLVATAALAQGLGHRRTSQGNPTIAQLANIHNAAMARPRGSRPLLVREGGRTVMRDVETPQLSTSRARELTEQAGAWTPSGSASERASKKVGGYTENLNRAAFEVKLAENMPAADAIGRAHKPEGATSYSEKSIALQSLSRPMKIQSFANNIEFPYDREARPTMDVWMGREGAPHLGKAGAAHLLGGGNRYLAVAGAMSEAAGRHGLAPHEGQASVWTRPGGMRDQVVSAGRDPHAVAPVYNRIQLPAARSKGQYPLRERFGFTELSASDLEDDDNG